MISFGSSPSPKPTPSFWNDPTTNASAGRPSSARASARVAGVCGEKYDGSIPIGIRTTLDGSIPLPSTTDSISLCDTSTRSSSSLWSQSDW